MDNMRNMEKTRSKRKVSLIVFVVLLFSFGVYGKVTNHLSDQWFLDRMTVANYQPSAEIGELVEKSSMNEQAKIYFYATEPQINDRIEFNQNCSELLNEATMILGCYDGHTYLFNVTDERISGVKYVTAAHEMLHSAYDRLGIFDKINVDELIRKEIEKTTNQDIMEAYRIYQELEPGQEINEMHSVLGTEIRNLSPELEAYYGRYFIDRKIIVSEHERYKAVFEEMENRANKLEGRLTELEDEIKSGRANYETAVVRLNADVDSFNHNASIGNFDDETSFYAGRNALIARQGELTAMVSSINAKIDEYNSIVADLQALGRDAEILQTSLDSKL